MRWVGILILAAALSAGCGNSETTVVGSNGETVTTSKSGGTTTYSDNKGNSATVSEDGKQMTFKNEKGESGTIGQGVSEADLGLPFYPGSVDKPGASVKFEQAGEKTVASSRTSKDEPAQVVAFYKDKIEDPKDSSVNSGDMKMGSLGGKLKDGAEVAIMASKTGSAETDVVVTVKHKK